MNRQNDTGLAAAIRVRDALLADPAIRTNKNICGVGLARLEDGRWSVRVDLFSGRVRRQVRDIDGVPVVYEVVGHRVQIDPPAGQAVG